jgi:hypothetical protein
MKSRIVLAAAVCLIVLSNSCREGITVPQEPPPGRRDYTWTVDEIKPGDEMLYLMNIWGSSANNVWAVGSSSLVTTCIWHYNGVQWRCDSIPRLISPVGVYGTTPDEVWLGNENSTIWRFNGTVWQLYGSYPIAGFDQVIINDFNGTERYNIYGIGFADNHKNNTSKAVLIHFSGGDWQYVKIPDTKVSLEFIAVDSGSGVLVMTGTNYDPSGFIPKVYCWDGYELKDIPFVGPGFTHVSKIGDEIFVTAGAKIYKYSDKQLSLWKDNTGTSVNGRLWCGRSRNDFFIKDYYGISHYNGTDFTTLYKTNIDVGLGTIFEKDVFFTGYDNNTGKNYIIHGKLN